jgi:orotidine-5'-phosphate decarboxylase
VSRNPLIVAADVADAGEAAGLARELSDVVAFVKVGLELFVAAGPDAVRDVRAHAPVFLDLKLHDIPNTVEGAARAAGRLGVGLLTVHALGGPAMVAAAVRGANDGAEEVGDAAPSIVAVTVLSSLGGEGLASPASLAFEAVAAGAAGVVVSGDDVAEVRAAVGPGPLLVVPGIRPFGHANDDQVRVLSPGEALERGADYLVVGRPITRSPNRRAAALAVLREAGVEVSGEGTA